MDAIAITETSEKEETGFLTNVEIEGYDLYHTSTKTAKGGSATYINKYKTLLNATILTLNILNMKLHGLKSKTKKIRI